MKNAQRKRRFGVSLTAFLSLGLGLCLVVCLMNFGNIRPDLAGLFFKSASAQTRKKALSERTREELKIRARTMRHQQPAEPVRQSGGENHALRPDADDSGYVIRGEAGRTVCAEAQTDEERALLRAPEPGLLQPLGPLGPDRLYQQSGNLKIQLNGTAQLNSFPQAQAAFQRAAAKWEAIIRNPITVVVNVDFGPTRFGQPYPSGVIGSAGNQTVGSSQNYPDFRRNLIAGASSPTEASLYNALPNSTVPTNLGNTPSIFAASAVFRALGLLPPIADPAGEQAQLGSPPSIGFNSAFTFDFDPSNGIDSGKTDFEGVALHELGHVLGFTSRVGLTELISNTPISLTTLDLFRFDLGVTLGTFSTAQRLLSSGGTHNFFDGGVLVQFSTGRPDAGGGDRRQASHWKDDALNGGQYIGIMDPTAGGSEPMRITAADLRAFETMGYQIGAQQGGDPCSTAQAITPGQTISGSLTGSDCQLDDGSYVDFYSFTGTAGQRIAIGLESNAFDAYLFLISGQNIVAEDDDGGGGTNSRIPAGGGFLTLPAAGTYVIAANSFDAGETGNYSLSLTSSGGSVPVISVEPASLDFGNVTINSTSNRSLTVRNTGTATLNVTGITSSNSRFSVTSGTSFNVAAGAQQSVTVRFSPTASGTQTGTLSIANNAGSNPTTVQLRGEGTQSTPTCPTVSGTVTPSSGAIGTSLTIAGRNLTGVTQVRFGGGATATPTVNSQGTQIQVTVPSGAQSGTVNLVKSGCQDVPAGSFQVTQAGNCVAVSIAQNLTRPPGSALSVPITVGDLTGKNVTSYDFTLNYNSSVLRPAGGDIADRANTLSSGFSVTVNGNNPGRLLVSAFGTSALSGAGTLLNLRFEVIGQAQACSDLTLNGFTLNNGTPCVNAANGRVCLVSGGSLSGTVGYGSSSTVVPGVRLTVTGAANATANTDASGNYQLPNLSGGPITVTPTKTDDFNAVKQFIRSADAALAARAAVELEQLNQFQRVAADVNNDNRINGFDAALIAKASVEIFDDPNSVVGTWKFVPDKREYGAIAGEMTGQNYTAVLVGDVNGDWRPATANLAATSDLNPLAQNRVEQPVFSVWTPSLKVARGRSAVWPVTVGNLTGLNVTSFDLDIFYDPLELRLHTPAVLTNGTLSAGMSIVVNDAVAGRLRISAYSIAPLIGGGDLLRLNFVALKDVDDTPAIFRNELQFNDGLPFAEGNITPGAFKNVSAADDQCTEFTAGALVAALGRHLTHVTLNAEDHSNTELAGVSVLLRDGAGVEWRAPVLFVSPERIHYQLPTGMAAGVTVVTLVRDGLPVGRGMLQINPGPTTREEQR